MATIANSLLYSPRSASIFLHNDSISSPYIFSRPILSTKTRLSCLKLQANDRFRIQEIHCSEEYDKGLQISHQKLVIAQFSASHYIHNSKIEQFMEEQCRLSNEIKFLYITANDSEKIKQLCRREKIDKIPYFVFYKKKVKINEVAGFQRKRLVEDILYYKDDHLTSSVVQLKCKDDFEKLIKDRKFDHRIVIINVCKNRCTPCAKIYPSVVKLASQMAGKAMFARMNVDENDWCMEMLRGVTDIRKVPAFLFFGNGELQGTFVGSSMSGLIKELVRLQSEQRDSALRKELGVPFTNRKQTEPTDKTFVGNRPTDPPKPIIVGR
ncbi:Thioredoxin-like protein cdsp32, chloroplastic [Castilleja foliolosa]|uniref:Thioredoxin-like protein cdsp32, chloroplastic n=1 Tax=Castilleja foliolosa TaxID=1961234 RepID=A0ABD3BWE0_9LAMI